jgi:hypothetical protein
MDLLGCQHVLPGARPNVGMHGASVSFGHWGA